MGNLQKKIHRKIWYIITQLYYRKSFKEIGKNSILFRPVQIDHESTIVIKENVSIYHSAWLMGNDQVEVSMYIGAGTTIGHYAHLVAKKKVCLGENVLVADELEKEPFDYDRYKELVGKFEDGRNDLLSQVTILGTQTEFLTTTKERLENNKIQIAEDYDNVVNVDMAEAIMDFSWAQYVYNASLKVGNNILTPSFIDFMN